MLEHALITHTGSTNAVGEETSPYTIKILKSLLVFGVMTMRMTQIIDQNTSVLTIQLCQVIMIILNLTLDGVFLVLHLKEWGERCQWVKWGLSPDDDSNSDRGSSAFVTGNAETFDADNDDG